MTTSSQTKQDVSRAVLITLARSKGHLLAEDTLWDHVCLTVRPRPTEDTFKTVLAELAETGMAKSLEGDLPGDAPRWLLAERGEAWAAKNGF